MNDLLERAKQYNAQHTRPDITMDHEELTLAWLRGEITATAIAHALGKNPLTWSPTSMILRSIRIMYGRGSLVDDVKSLKDSAV